jgi:hypothetical protein
LLEQTRGTALPLLTDAFDVALGRLDDALFDRAERAGQSQLAFLDGMRELRRRRHEVVGTFRAQLNKAWQAMLARTPLSVEHVLVPPQLGSLSLVSEEELESRLAARNLAAAIQRDFKPMLARLDHRLGRLAGMELNGNYNPIGSGHVAVAVRESLADCDFNPEVRLVVLKLCERDLVPELGRVYEKLDQQLGLAEIDSEQPDIHDRVSQQARKKTPLPFVDGDEDDTPAWAARFLNHMSALRGYGQPQANAHNVAAGYNSTGEPRGTLLDALYGLMHESRGMGPAPPVSGRRSLSQREMISALSLLQNAPSAALRAAIGDAEESLSQRLKSEVMTSASRLGMDMSAARLSQTDEDAIDLVGMLFDVLLDERSLQGHSRDLIGRLVVPFVKVAMLDRHMFVQKQHPARRLLNSLAEACEDNNGETAADRTLMSKVEEIVGRLVAEFNENVAIFNTLEEEFREFQTQHQRRIEIAERRAAEIQRGQERLDTARLRMESELASRLNGRKLPQAIEDFLRQPWAHHVTMHLLREGDGSQNLQEALALADGLLEELEQAQRRVVGKPWLLAWRPTLFKVFGNVGLSADAAGAAVNALHDTLQAVAQARPDMEKPLPELPPVALPKADEEGGLTPMRLVGGADTLGDFDPTDADHFRKLPIGTWLDFIGKDNKLQPGKLSWVSPISSRLLFVNRRGVRFCVASPEELAVMVRMGRLRKHEEEDAFDAAMMGVIAKLDSSKRTAESLS